MNKSQIINRLKEIEPRYSEWNDNEIENQIEKIFECGYEWDNDNSKFFNKEIGMYLKVEGLNLFKPEDINDFYERVWSKERPKSEQKVKSSKRGCLLFLIVSVIYYFLIEYGILDLNKWYISIPVAILSFILILHISSFFGEKK